LDSRPFNQSNKEGEQWRTLIDMHKTTGREKLSVLEWKSTKPAHDAEFDTSTDDLMPVVASKYSRAVEPVSMAS